MEITERINYIVGKIVVYMMILVYPFVMHNKLNDVTLTRFLFFVIVSYISFIVMVVNRLAGIIIKKAKSKKNNDLEDITTYNNIRQSEDGNVKYDIDLISTIKDKEGKIDSWKKIIVVFLLTCVLSYICSPYKSIALLGRGGRYTGLVFYGACVCMYYVVSTCYKFEKRDITYILCSSILVNIWAVLNYAGVDPFYIYRDVPAAMKTVYISSLGNIDIYGMYVNMMLAIAMFSFVYEESMHGKVFYGFAALLCMMGSLASDSDMAIAGMFFAFVVLFYFTMSQYHMLIRYFMLAVGVFISGRLLGIIYIFNPYNTRIIKSIGSIIIYKNVFVIFPIICFIAIFAVQMLDERFKLFNNKALSYKIRKIYAALVIAMSVVVCLAVIICTTVSGKTALAITDDWGSGRGYIWKNVLNGYGNLPFINKIFGAGEATTAWVLSDYSSAASNILNRGRVDNAHNIWINMLVTIGIAGLTVYVLLLSVAIRNMVKYLKCMHTGKNAHKTEYMLLGAGLAVVVYSIQGTAEMLEVITFPVFFCLLAMLNCGTIDKNSNAVLM